jgi:hypothetical protein
MPDVRIHYDGKGHVLAVEHRPLGRFDDEPPEGVRTLVVDAEEVAGVPAEELTVRRGKLKRTLGAADDDADPTAAAGAARLEEIRALDKSSLDDQEWLKLYREYLALTGSF